MNLNDFIENMERDYNYYCTRGAATPDNNYIRLIDLATAIQTEHRDLLMAMPCSCPKGGTKGHLGGVIIQCNRCKLLEERASNG